MIQIKHVLLRLVNLNIWINLVMQSAWELAKTC